MSKCSLLADLSRFTYCYIILFNPAYLLTGVENLADIDRLMSGTDTETVKLLLDTGHLRYAGVYPLAVTQKYAARIEHVL